MIQRDHMQINIYMGAIRDHFLICKYSKNTRYHFTQGILNRHIGQVCWVSSHVNMQVWWYMCPQGISRASSPNWYWSFISSRSGRRKDFDGKTSARGYPKKRKMICIRPPCPPENIPLNDMFRVELHPTDPGKAITRVSLTTTDI